MTVSRLAPRTTQALALALFLFSTSALRATEKWDTFRTSVPETIDDLKALQDTVGKVADKCTPYTVGIRFLDSQGSGVIVSEDGLVLTAGHVSGEPGRKCKIILPDGKMVDGKTLGQNKKMDSGMVQITTAGPKDGKWPFAEIAKSGELKKNQWLVSLGHPNGYKEGRLPVARLGRLDDIVNGSDPNSINSRCLRTTCTLVGGDSGGPLFNLDGKLVGIHSQIGPSIKWNMHVPVDEFRKDWDLLTKGDKVTREAKVTKPTVSLGVTFIDEDDVPAKLTDIVEGGAAEAAGLKPGDIITSFDGKKVESMKALRDLLLKYKPDTEVEIVVKRGSKVVTVTMVLAKRAS